PKRVVVDAVAIEFLLDGEIGSKMGSKPRPQRRIAVAPLPTSRTQMRHEGGHIGEYQPVDPLRPFGKQFHEIATSDQFSHHRHLRVILWQWRAIPQGRQRASHTGEYRFAIVGHDARGRGASSFSRPTRYKITQMTANGMSVSASEFGPSKNG